MEEPRSTTDDWSTDDMALAAYLALEGDELQRMTWEMDSCFFVFHETEDLLDHVQDFVSGDARVDPRRYNMQFGQLKRSMFSHPRAPARPSRRTAIA